MDPWIHDLETAFSVPRLELAGGKIFVPDAPVCVDDGSAAYPFVRFQWDEWREPRWIALDLRGVGRMGVMICVQTEESAPHAIAAAVVRHPVELFSRFFQDFLARNGAAYGVPLFGRLPSLTVNHRPDLLPADAIETGHRSWIEWAESVGSSPWGDIEAAVTARLRRAGLTRRYPAPHALFQTYFGLSYSEAEARR